LTRIFLIRHAEAEGNIFRRAHGQVNGQIIGRGFRQIELLRDRFAGERIDAVYSSDLSRAKMTAAALSEPRSLPIILSEMLREVRMGVWEDKPWGNMEHHDPEMGKYFTTDPARWCVEGSESFEQVQDRMVACITEIAERHDGETVAAFSHGFAIRAFMCRVMGVPSHESMVVPYCDNSAVALLVYENGELTIEFQGDNSHLSEETSTFANQTWWRKEKEWIRENARFEPFDKQRDKGIAAMCFEETGIAAETVGSYAVFLTNEPIGLMTVDNGCIMCMYVKPELRRMGYGVQLLGQAVSDSRMQGFETLRVEVLAGSAIHSFCLKYRFAESGKAGECLVMEKDIRN